MYLVVAAVDLQNESLEEGVFIAHLPPLFCVFF